MPFALATQCMKRDIEQNATLILQKTKIKIVQRMYAVATQQFCGFLIAEISLNNTFKVVKNHEKLRFFFNFELNSYLA